MERRNSYLVASAVAVLLLTLIPGTVTAATYYVSPAGNNSDQGTLDHPWQTIQHAAEVAEAGDTVLIREGTYHENVYLANGGNPTEGYIIFAAYPGENPIINGTGVTESANGVIVANAYIKLAGLEICHWPENGIWAENAAYLQIADCDVHHVEYGIGVAYGTHDFILDRVEMHHFNLYGFDASPSGGADCYNGTFNDCRAHTCLDPGRNVDGFALGHGTQHDFVFNRCEAYDVYDGFDISARNTTLNRCSAHACLNGGYKLWQDNVTLVNCLSYHNTVTNVELDWDGEPGTTTLQNCNFVDVQTFNIWVENPGDSLRMYSCILAGGDAIGLAFEQQDASTYQGDYNIFHNDNTDRVIAVGYEDEFTMDQLAAGNWTAYSGQDAHSMVAAAPTAELFQNLAGWDLHLRPGSLAIDSGTAQGAPSEDYDGNPRPQGAGYDVGCYEFVTAQQSIIINHTCTNLSRIPETGINAAKEKLHIAYGHTSHGSQLITGMDGLDAFLGNTSLFVWNDGPLTGYLDLDDYAFDDYGAYDLGNPDFTAWVQATRDYLNDPDHSDVNVVVWSWCGQLSWMTSEEVTAYLNNMTLLESEYPTIDFVYMTGHLNIWDWATTTANNQQIRNYCRANNKILYDFADIESYNPDGVFYEYANDDCTYYDDQTGSNCLGNWAQEWQSTHAEGAGGAWYDCGYSDCCAHSEPLNCNQKAYAAWWLWARLAGWGDGGAPPGQVSSLTGTLTYACNGTGIAEVIVNLIQNGSLRASTASSANGQYSFTNLSAGAYTVNVSRLRCFENSSTVTINAGEPAVVNLTLWLKGDLNNNCVQADAGDLAKLKDASVGKIGANKTFDLNNNTINADAGDLAKLKDASVGKIELL
jgi:hypothetical protein